MTGCEGNYLRNRNLLKIFRGAKNELKIFIRITSLLWDETPI